MAHPWHHAMSSAKRFGGVADDYLAVHGWFDQTKGHWADARHRAILHSSFGIFLCEQFFGPTIKRRSDGKLVPTRLIGEQHVLEDLGRIPSVQDWLEGLPMQAWMLRNAAQLSKQFGDVPEDLQNAEVSPARPLSRKAADGVLDATCTVSGR